MTGFLAANIDLITGVLLGCIWTACLFAIFISRHLP